MHKDKSMGQHQKQVCTVRPEVVMQLNNWRGLRNISFQVACARFFIVAAQRRRDAVLAVSHGPTARCLGSPGPRERGALTASRPPAEFRPFPRVRRSLAAIQCVKRGPSLCTPQRPEVVAPAERWWGMARDAGRPGEEGRAVVRRRDAAQKA